MRSIGNYLVVLVFLVACGGGEPDGADQIEACRATWSAIGYDQCSSVCNQIAEGTRAVTPSESSCSTSCLDGALSCGGGSVADGQMLDVDGDQGCCLQDTDGAIHWCGCN